MHNNCEGDFMRKEYIFNIVKDVLIKACVYFSLMILVITAIGAPFNQNLNTATCFMFALAAFGAGASAQIFKIDKLPAPSRHIAFFICLYFVFIFIVLPFSGYSPTRSDSTLLMSVAFIIIYLIILGIAVGIKAINNAVKNKKLKYENQFNKF